MFSGLGGVRGTNFAKPRSGFGSTTGYSNNGDASQPVYGRMPQGATLSNNGKGGYSMGSGGQGGVQGAGRVTGIDSLGRHVSIAGQQGGGPETWGTSNDYSPWGQQGSYAQLNNGMGSAAGATQVGGQQGYPTNDLFKDAEPASSAEGQTGSSSVQGSTQQGYTWGSGQSGAVPPGGAMGSPAVQYQGGPVNTGANYNFTQNPYNHAAVAGSPQVNMSPIPGGNGPWMNPQDVNADGTNVPPSAFGGGNSSSQSSGFVSPKLQKWLTNNPGQDISRYWEQYGDANPGSRPQYGPQVRTYR